MIQITAKNTIANLRAEVGRAGYERANKLHVAVLFGDLKLLYATAGEKFNPEKRDEVAALERQWMKDRNDVTQQCGAATIEVILRKLETYTPDLPTTIKPAETIIPSKAEQETDRVLAVMKQRGYGLHAATV